MKNVVHYFYQKRIRISYLGLVVGLFGLFLAIFYRPYIYSNYYNDFHFADTLGSLFCVPSSTLLYYGFSRKLNFRNLLLTSLGVFILYEVPSTIQYGIDIYDYFALFISALCTYSFFKIIKYIHKKNQISLTEN